MSAFAFRGIYPVVRRRRAEGLDRRTQESACLERREGWVLFKERTDFRLHTAGPIQGLRWAWRFNFTISHPVGNHPRLPSHLS